jgi:hypothetical protein
MRSKLFQIALAVLMALATLVGIYKVSLPAQAQVVPPPPIPSPGLPVDVAEFIAWQLFVNAVSPSSPGENYPLTFENWTEQCTLDPNLPSCPTPSGTKGAAKSTAKNKVRHGHGSALAKKLRQGTAGSTDISAESCGSMTPPTGLAAIPASAYTPGFPAVPATNVAANAVFCEEVFVNPAELAYITTNQFGSKYSANVNFPWNSVEIKVDWAPAASFIKAPPDLANCQSTTVYTEMITFQGANGKPLASTCYAMVGMHISSKIIPNWLWATFEPNQPLTNPNRCNPNLYGPCLDTWGTTSSVPYSPAPYSQTPLPQQSPALAGLMQKANLQPVFSNYFLTGVQTQHVLRGQPTQLGNSFVEFNAGVQQGQASCMTCHNYAYSGTTLVGGPPLLSASNSWPSIGYACNIPGATQSCAGNVPGATTSQDFSWLLNFMMPANSGATKAQAKAPAKSSSSSSRKP